MPSDKKPKKSNRGKTGKGNKIKERALANAKAQKTTATFKVQPGMHIIIPQDDNHEIQRGLYSDELLPKLEELASKGLTNAEIATALGIGNKTFYDWRHRYPQFLHSLNKYRGVADIMVENALYATAVGFNYSEQQVTPTGKVVTVEKYQTGNASAQKFYLVNRMKGRYKNKIEQEISVTNDISQMLFSIKRREVE